jgi:hypothetical protein
MCGGGLWFFCSHTIQAATPVFTESYTLRTDAYNTMKIDYIVPIAKNGPFDDQSLLDIALGG